MGKERGRKDKLKGMMEGNEDVDCVKKNMRDMKKMKEESGMYEKIEENPEMKEKMEKYYQGEEMSEEDKKMMKEGMFGGDEEKMNKMDELMRGKKECMGRAEEKKKQFYEDNKDEDWGDDDKKGRREREVMGEYMYDDCEKERKEGGDDMEEMMCDEYPEMFMTDDDKMKKGKEREERRKRRDYQYDGDKDDWEMEKEDEKERGRKDKKMMKDGMFGGDEEKMNKFVGLMRE